MHWNEEYYLLGHDTHSPMPFLVPPCPGPKVSVGLFTEPCPFHLVPIPCCDILFYHEDVNRRHTPPETLHGIKQGFSLLVSKEPTAIISSWMAKPYWWRYYNHMKFQEFWNSMTQSNILGLNLQQHHYENLNSCKVYKHLTPKVSKFLPHYVASHHTKWEPHGHQ
jgi:hypothetical protein